MPFLDGDVVVKEINEKEWRLLHPLVYRLYRQTYVVPAHFKTDFATVPRIFIWLVPPYGKYTKATILHDFLCRAKRVNRSKADMIFRRAMRELGVSFLRRWLMWAAVRAGARLKDTYPREVFKWLLVTIPAVIFLIIPAMVVLIWLTLYWILEYIFFGAFKPFRREPNKPNFLLGADALEKED
jgi:hypothetical protein